MKVKIELCLCLFASILLYSSCQKDLAVQEPVQLSKTDESQYYTPSKAYLDNLDALTRHSEVSNRAASCNWVEIPAGSINALAQALNNVCAGGVIYLKTGVHTENNAITISKSVKIIGEAGAVLKVKSSLTASDPVTGAWAMNPALHILNAPRTAILDLDIQSFPVDGSTAILLENSMESAVIRCKIGKFQSAILVEKSDRVAIMRNTVVSTTAWQNGVFSSGESIVVINGKSAYISDNEVSDAVFGIWPCDKWGTVERNYTHGCFLGIILCKVPPGAYILPSGRGAGAEFASTSVKTLNNKSTDNQWGILVIDGANNSLLVNNELARNAAYDIELTTDTYRFGFLTPMSFDNIVNAGSFQTVRIKDCGRNNQVTGGVRVNTVTDPCN